MRDRRQPQRGADLSTVRAPVRRGAARRSPGSRAARSATATTDDDGRLPSLAQPARRIDINAHVDEHDRFPVGDDAWLETLRDHDRIRLGRWSAPFDLVRRYLVTGVVDAGRNRLAQHNAIVMAMTQIQRGAATRRSSATRREWIAARDAVAQLMDRYHATDARRRVAG